MSESTWSPDTGSPSTCRTVLVAVVLCAVSLSTALAGSPARGIQFETGLRRSDGPPDCSNAVSISDGQTVHGTNIGAPGNVDSYSCVTWFEGGGEVVYELVLPGPEATVVAATLSGLTCDLDLFLLSGCAENECLAAGNLSLVSDALSPGIYYLVVDGYDGAECPFRLSVDCMAVGPECSPLADVCTMLDFGESDNGFQRLACGGAQVWEWGECVDSSVTCSGGRATRMLATCLDGSYPANSGEAALVGPLSVTAECSWLELCHDYCTEKGYDGGNVKVSTDGGATWELVCPSRGYDSALCDGVACVGMEPAFGGEPVRGWRNDCFDLGAYEGSDVTIGFFFGSDADFCRDGWRIASVALGSAGTNVEPMSWGAIKALYR